MIEGVEATERQLLATLERHGIKRIETEGAKFDPNLHQAIAEVPGEGRPARHHRERCPDRLCHRRPAARPAMVTVARKDEGGAAPGGQHRHQGLGPSTGGRAAQCLRCMSQTAIALPKTPPRRAAYSSSGFSCARRSALWLTSAFDLRLAVRRAYALRGRTFAGTAARPFGPGFAGIRARDLARFRAFASVRDVARPCSAMCDCARARGRRRPSR